MALCKRCRSNIQWQSADPRWLHDGSGLVFCRGRSDFPPASSQVFVFSLTSRKERPLTSGPGLHLMPEMSPDGRQIAYSFAPSKSDTRRIVVEDLRTHSKRFLTHEDLGNEHFPCWSPDGNQIVFNADAKGHRQIYVASSSGSKPLALTPPSSNSDDPRWSGDGRSIIFESDQAGMWQICSVDPSGHNRHEIAFGSTPELSQDGKHFVFDDSIPTGTSHIYEFASDGTQSRGIGPNDEVWEPAWSPDGKRIAFMSRYGGHFEVWVMNSDGTHATQLTHSRPLP